MHQALGTIADAYHVEAFRNLQVDRTLYVLCTEYRTALHIEHFDLGVGGACNKECAVREVHRKATHIGEGLDCVGRIVCSRVLLGGILTGGVLRWFICLESHQNAVECRFWIQAFVVTRPKSSKYPHSVLRVRCPGIDGMSVPGVPGRSC